MKSLFVRFALLILFFIELCLVQGGLIRGWDIIVDSSNRNLLSTYAFVFQLDESLDSSDKILIEMPYLLHSTVLSSSPVELTALFGQISYSSCDPGSDSQTAAPWSYINQDQLSSVSIYVSGTTSKQYYFSLPNSISSSLEYVLLLTSSVIPLTQSVGIKDFIKIYSVSSNDPTAIIYDRNELFSSFELTSDAPSSLVVGYEVFASNQNEYEAVYEIFVEILNNQDYLTISPYGSLYEIRFGSGSSSPFSFMPTNNGLMSHICESQSSNSNGYVITAIPASAYNCVVTSDVIRIQVTSPLPSLSRLRFSFFVQNPNFTLTSKESIAIKRFKINSRQVVEMGQSIGFLSVTGILVSSRSMQIGWGMDETLQVAPLQLLPLIKNAPTGLGTYNSIKFVFTPSHGTPDGVIAELEFSIATGANGDSTVLTGSIIHNFPETNLGKNKRVECSTTGDGPSRKIVCTNLGKLISSTQYFVGFKMMFFNTATISSSFSQFSGYLLDPSNNYSRFVSPLISNFKISRTSTFTLSTNKNFYLPGTASTAISSQLVSSTLPSLVYSPHGDATNGILGIVPEDTLNTAQKLVFSMSLLPSDITSIVDTQTIIQTGFFMVTNPNIIQFDSSSLSIDQYGALLVSQQVQKVKLSSTTYSTTLGQYTRLKLQTNLAADITNMFTSGLLFAIRNVFVRQHSSFYGDDNVLDFYFYFYDDIENVLPTFKFALLYNAYTINTPKPYNIRYSVVNWYGGATITNDGSYVPTFIRLAGYFNEGELRSGSQRLALFFTGLDFFEDDGVSIYSYDSSCSSSVGSSPTLCRGFTSSASVQQNYLHMRRVEVQFPTTVPSGSVNFFELLIPVKTIAAVTNIQLFVSLLRYHDIIPINTLAQASMKNYFFHPTSVFRLTGSNNLQDTTQFISFPSSAATIMPLFSGYMVTNITSIDNYSVNLSESKVGEITSQVSINARHTESYPVVGTNSLNSFTQENGAGFTFATSYDFRTSSQLYFWEGGLSSSIRKCLSFQYNKDGISLWRYGLFCSMEQATQATVSQVNVTFFQLPYTNGNQLPSTTSFAFSTSMGNIATLKFGSQTIKNPNSIEVDLNSASPTLMMGSKNNRIAWTFATTNPIPENAYVRITFQDPLQISLIGSNCKFQIATSHTCTVSIPTGIDFQLLFQLTSCSGCAIPAGNVQILHYGIDAHVSPTPSNLFLIETLTSTFSIIDSTLPSLHYPSPLNTYNVLTSQNIALVSSQVEVKLPYQQAESEISVSFYTPNNLDLLVGEIVFLNLNTDLSTVNQASINSQVYCFVTQNKTVVHSFLGVTIANTASVFTVSMKVKKDISLSASNPLKLICRNVRMPTLSTLSNLPSLTIYKSDGVSKVFSTTTATFPILLSSTIISSSSVSRGSFNTYGSVSTLVFSFTASTATSGSVFFLIRFSNVYLPKLSQDSSLQCLINTLVVPCTITQSWTLRISGVPLGSTVFSIQIKGVQVPNILTAAASHQNFFIALVQQDLGSGLLSLLNFQFLSDINAIAQQTNSFQLTAVQLATTHIQQTNSITFNFTLSNTFLVSGQTYKILVTFPVHWKDLLQLLTPRVSLRRVSTNSFISLTTTVTTMISISFTWTVTPAALEPFILTLANISNPEQSVCILSRQWVLHVQRSTDDQTLFSRSIPMTSQVPYFRFNSYKKQLVPKWKYPDGQTAYTLNRGQFKTLVTLVLDSGDKFTHPLRISLQQSSLFTIDSTNPFAAPGQTSLSFYLSTSSTTPTSEFVVYFQKLNDYFSSYTNLPVCQVNVVHETQQIEYVNTQWPLEVPKNGNSGSLVLRYKDQGYLVTRNATISVTVIDGSNFGISVKGDSAKIMKTTRTNPKVTFFFSASSSSIVGYQVSIQFSLSVADSLGNSIADRFSLPNNQVLEVSLQGSSGTVYSISSSAFKSVSTNSIIFRPICPQQGIIFYKVFLDNIYNFSSLTDPQIDIPDNTSLRQEIYSNSIDYFELSSSDSSQKQYGFVQNNPQLSAETEITITNLLSSKNYTILAYCENFFSLQSSNLLQLNFSTSSNGGSILKTTLTFDKNLTLPEKIKALCYLSIFLTIPPANIYSSDKATCSPYSQQYDFSNTLSKLQNFDSVVSPYLTVYFIPDWSKNSDKITNIVKSSYASSSFAFRLKSFLAQYSNYYFTDWELDLPDVFSSTFASLLSTSSLQTVSSTIPRIDAAYFIDINQNSQKLTVDQIRLTDNGFIFVGLENKLQNLLKQQDYDNYSPNALVNGLNYFGNSVTYGTQLKEGFSVIEKNFTFNNLVFIDNYDWYEVFIAVSQEDPSPFAAKSTIRKQTLINFQLAVSSGFIMIESFIVVFICLFL